MKPKKLPGYLSPAERGWFYVFRFYGLVVLFFLVVPLVVIVPLSFNATPYFTFTKGMLEFQPSAYSLKWYETFFTNSQWLLALKNSFIIAPIATLIATTLGTLAALGLTRPNMPFKTTITALLVLPMIVPLIITATALFFYFSYLHIVDSYVGVIIAHAILGTPFVVITVTATLEGLEPQFFRAALSLGATPRVAFFKVVMPLVLPGIVSGALFAFMTSFDEVVIVLFIAGPDQKTLPLQMWTNLRYTIDPTILAVASLILLLAVVLLGSLELIRRRSEKMRGLSPQ
ncbi:MAG: ABC transporter permease [Allgaiera sp.]|jgi:putative spermidine/putrescine transport system permease protein|nr:ABC transporter permease [Allgaiera sp.]